MEPESGFTADGHGFLENLEGLPAPAFGQHRLAQVQKTALHEAARAQAVHDRPGLLDLPLQAREVAQRERRKDPGHSGVELGAVMADPVRCFSRRQRLLEHRLLRAEVEARMSALAAVRNLDAAEAVLGG